MGGWTRIWVVLTVAMSVIAAWTYTDRVQSAERRANQEYRTALDAAESCRQTLAAGQPGASDAFGQLLYRDCADGAKTGALSAAQLASKRDDAIAVSKRDLAIATVSFVAWVSGSVGAFGAAPRI